MKNFSTDELHEIVSELSTQLDVAGAIIEIYLDALEALSKVHVNEPRIWDALDRAGELAENENKRLATSKAAALLVPDEGPYEH